MIAMIWRFLVAVLDWRTVWRKLNGYPTVDVVFVSNLRDREDRENLGNLCPVEGHFNSPRCWLDNISGRTRVLDITTDEMGGRNGFRKKAYEQFIAATRWAEQNGAKVILLAAATKRLFKREELAELKAEFPGIIFT